MLSSVLPIIALIVGTLLGLQLPDADRVFTLIGGVIVQLGGSQARQLQQTNRAIAADVLTNLVNVDAQLGFVAKTIDLRIDRNSNGDYRLMLITAQIADPRQALASQPLCLDQGTASQAQLNGLRVLHSTGVDPQMVSRQLSIQQQLEPRILALIEDIDRLTNERLAEMAQLVIKRSKLLEVERGLLAMLV